MEWLLLTLVLVSGYIAWSYNRLVACRNTVKEAWAGIDVQLQRRHELVPNLVTTVKGYMQHEADVLESTTLARHSLPSQAADAAAQENTLSRSLGKLFALAESYPDLKASKGFQQLHTSLVEIEKHLQFARRYYNGAVRDNNNRVESFPVNLVARAFDFRPAAYFEIELASQREVPDVQI